MMYKRLILFMCIVFISSSVGCNAQNVKNSKDIYIPILADAAWLSADTSFVNGVMLAEEELNKEYSGLGFNVKTEIIDDKALYETGVELATKLSQNEKVTAVFNLQNFDVSKTTADILSDGKKIAIFPYGAYDSIFQKNNPYLFCGAAAFSDLGRAMAAYAVKNGYKRIAVYHNGKQSQEELVAAFEVALLNTGTRVIDYVPAISSQSEFNSIYSRWQALDADCVIIAQYGLERAFEVLKMLRGKSDEIAVIGEPIFNRANALLENSKISEGMAVPSTMVLEESSKLSAFKEKYRSKYGIEADIWAVQGYDMLRLVTETAVNVGSNNPEKIAEALHNDTGYKGVGRNIAFEKGGAMVVDINKLPMLKCRNGRFE